MTRHITRRDFLNGSALLITSLATGTLTACSDDTPTPQTDTPKASGNTPPPTAKTSSNYPPELTGLRGDHTGSYDVAHEMAWKKVQFDVSGESVSETVDLVVVGAGISGLASAYFYQKKFPSAKILVLDNHDDFGGHAKRNEFSESVDGKDIFRISYGGSESIDTPSDYSDEAMGLLNELGIDVQKFYTYYDQDYFKNLGMNKQGVFFNKATFGQSVVLPDEPNADNAAELFAKAPLADTDKNALIELYTTPKDYLGDMAPSEREDYLQSISYDKFLKDHVKLPQGAMAYMEEICLEYWGFNIDGLSAYDAFYEGHAGLELSGLEADDDGESEPYIFHFPDGNASIARLLVKKMIPAVVANPDHANGKSEMEAIVLDKFDYTKLDMPEQSVNIRLNTTAVQVKNIEIDGKKGVMIGYKKDGKLYRVNAHHCILACQHGMIPLIDSDLPQTQKDDHLQNIRVPMIYTKILVKDWQAFKKLGAWQFYAPKAPYCFIMTDYPVSMGGYHCPKDPSEPMVIHMVRIAVPYGTGKDVREACKIGRSELYRASYHDLEKQALDQLREMYDVAGESLDDKILAITINRWGHGYSYEQNTLFDDDDVAGKTLDSVKQAHDNIHMANSDSDWMPYADGAIDQAWRAVQEIKA
ncbi:NAD(P)-binding protein [Moraxella lacunata]|uniref:NAD(P)-binding protein n=1 Tax=Moraxella lacunata TaxID=477 RepID=UPI002481950D|nr:NAD(P)-binding protein [Moraxella lacunata]MDH9219061.1 NAD(P)-binding protein [Moraxella lacunata]